MEIKFVKNFLNTNDFEEVVKTVNNGKWTLQSSDSRDKTHLEFLYQDQSNNQFFNTYLFNKVKEHIDGNFELSRIYFNGQWSGRDGNFHSDDCDVTALFYVSPYEYGWGGFTEIMTDNPLVIHPLQNSLLIFPGRIAHKGYSFSYQTCPMRISLAFKINYSDDYNT